MPDLTATLTVAANGAPTVLTLAVTGDAGCAIAAEYEQDQFYGPGTNRMYLRPGHIAPSGVCLPRMICLRPLAPEGD